MPDESRGRETDLVISILDAPTKVNVISRFSKYRVKASDFVEHPFVKGHVAAGDVLGFAVSEHHVCGPARSRRHRRRHLGILRRRKIVAADTHKLALHQFAYKEIEP